MRSRRLQRPPLLLRPLQDGGRVNNAQMASVPGHPIWRAYQRAMRAKLESGERHPLYATGPAVLTDVIRVSSSSERQRRRLRQLHAACLHCWCRLITCECATAHHCVCVPPACLRAAFPRRPPPATQTMACQATTRWLVLLLTPMAVLLLATPPWWCTACASGSRPAPGTTGAARCVRALGAWVQQRVGCRGLLQSAVVLVLTLGRVLRAACHRRCSWRAASR